MASIRISNILWGIVSGIGLLVLLLLFYLIWITLTIFWAFVSSGILALALGVFAYFFQAFIEKPIFGQISALVFGVLGIVFLIGGAWQVPDVQKIPCLIAVLIVAVIVFGFGAWKLKDMEREKEIKSKRKRL